MQPCRPVKLVSREGEISTLTLPRNTKNPAPQVSFLLLLPPSLLSPHVEFEFGRVELSCNCLPIYTPNPIPPPRIAVCSLCPSVRPSLPPIPPSKQKKQKKQNPAPASGNPQCRAVTCLYTILPATPLDFTCSYHIHLRANIPLSPCLLPLPLALYEGNLLPFEENTRRRVWLTS